MFSTDVAYGGLGGVRDVGNGEIALAGVTGDVTKALLYWQGPTHLADDAAGPLTITFDGQSVTGSQIGASSDNCWGYANSRAYRADVTSLVDGNGTYPIANLVQDSVNVNGVSLVVFFDDGNEENDRDIVLFDGNDSNIENGYDALGWNVSLAGIEYEEGDAALDLHVGDGQQFPDDALVVNGTTIVESGPVFDGGTVPNGPSASATNGGLWDIRSFDVTSLLTPGTNSLELTSGQVSDCLSLVLAAVNLPAGAAPDQPPPPPPPPPGCEEDGLASVPAAGVASGAVHGLEPQLGPLGEPVHGLNCDVVVPLEDQVDAALEQ